MKETKSPPGPPIAKRVLIVDDHPILRRGLIALLGEEPDLEVCMEAATRRAAVGAVASSRPDLVITDLSLSDGGGLAMVQEIRERWVDLPILILTMHDTPFWIERAFEAGANGYVTKQELGETLLLAIRKVLGGERYLSPRSRSKNAGSQMSRPLPTNR